MTDLQGDIEAALAWGQTQIGCPYDHAESPCRFGNCTPIIYDCSGFVSASLWHGGMPRKWQGFPEASGSMAQWAHAHSDMNIGVNAAIKTRGAILTAGGLQNGPDGHVVFSLGDGRILQSSGDRGVNIATIMFDTWTDGFLPPVNMQPAGPPPMTPAELEALIAFLHLIDNARKDEPAMPKQFKFRGSSHVMQLTLDGRLRQDFWNGTHWLRDYPAEYELPSARFAPGQTLDVKTLEAGQSENPIDVYALGKLGEFVHVYLDAGERWHTEVDPH